MIVIKSTCNRDFPGTGFKLQKGTQTRFASDAEFRKLPGSVRDALAGMARNGQIEFLDADDAVIARLDMEAAKAAKEQEKPKPPVEDKRPVTERLLGIPDKDLPEKPKPKPEAADKTAPR